ncbi:MAG TPA: hypothetical protein VFH45_00850 [Acidimicrobiales bacterium]|nr:hypothetical protein [Acidimicrobiales bacterium]
MGDGSGDHIWELRSPDGGMLGLEFARAVVAAGDSVLAHSLPSKVDVTVHDGDGRLVAKADGLEADGSTPMARLTIEDGEVRRQQLWPGPSDVGAVVILPGGEAGTLLSWWNAEDRSEWRWRVEFHNKV